jgi:hypothetical protein
MILRKNDYDENHRYLFRLTCPNSAFLLKNILHDGHERIPKLINNAGAPQILHCRKTVFDFCIIFVELVINILESISFIIKLGKRHVSISLKHLVDGEKENQRFNKGIIDEERKISFFSV